jgi:hypothetical protein
VRAAIPAFSCRLWCLAALLGALAAPPVAARAGQAAPRSGSGGRELTRLDSRRLLEKVAVIEQIGAQPPRAGRPVPPASRTTIVSERELNAYLTFDAGPQIPVGIAQPRISILDDRRVAATALVDLDAVRVHRKATGWFDPASYLTGRLPVALAGRLVTANGVARFDLESATISGVPMPKALLQEIVAHYSRTPENPRGYSLDDQFLLPAGIRQIEVRRGEAIVIQ